MKGIGKGILIVLLMISVCMLGTVSLTTEQVEAKAKPKISKKSVFIAKGGSQKITVKGGKAKKWTIQNNGVAKISKKTKKSATIVPVKAGTTVLTCKVKGKKFKCKVRVLNNSVGSTDDLSGGKNGHYSLVVGDSWNEGYTAEGPLELQGLEYDANRAKVTHSVSNQSNGNVKLNLTLKALKPGHFDLNARYIDHGVQEYDNLGSFTIINGFRGKAKAKKTNKNYKAWRTKTINSMANANMTTWQMVDAIGYLISTGKYSSKGGATGKQLWYGGNGTCVSGANMMNDFMKDLGISSKIHFMGKSRGATDINGYYIMYASQHKNTWIKLGGKRYELNAQPGAWWPVGVVRR